MNDPGPAGNTPDNPENPAPPNARAHSVTPEPVPLPAALAYTPVRAIKTKDGELKKCSHVWKFFKSRMLPGTKEEVLYDRCSKPWCSRLMAYTLVPRKTPSGVIYSDRIPVRIVWRGNVVASTDGEEDVVREIENSDSE